ncbi:YceD family protein [Profundibacter sp.]
MANKAQNKHRLRVSTLDTRKPTAFELTPAAPARKKIAAQLELLELRKLRFTGDIRATGKADWTLEGTLGATVVQPCVVTLEPVTTRIDVPVLREFIDQFEQPAEEEEEIEISPDDNSEPLGSHIDLETVMIEALSLALPLYPRADGAELAESIYAPEGIQPMRDEDTKPFAGLASLRDKLEKGE